MDNNQQDGYKNRVSDQYKNSGAYRDDNAYGKKSPYDEEGGGGGLGVCSFWFEMKVKLQELMSSDIGMQAEKRVVTMDTDPFKLWLIFKLTSRSFSNMFFVPFIVVLGYVLFINAGELLSFLIALLLVLYNGWVLYCPGHQTYTAGAYAIHKNSIDLYKFWRVQFKFYQTVSIMGFLLGSMFVAGVSYFNEVYNYVIEYVQIGFNFIHYPINLESVSRERMQNSAIVITSINGVSILGYFLFASYLTEKAKEKRVEYKKRNITNRTNSILAQRKAILRGQA